MTYLIARSSARVLLLVLPLLVVTLETDAVRTIDVTVSRFAFSPARIELRAGERTRLNIASADGTHGFQVKELDVDVEIPGGGETMSIEITPEQAGTFTVRCSEYCGRGHNRMTASLIVAPPR
jgi:cytochrome c oxidase subunit II